MRFRVRANAYLHARSCAPAPSSFLLEVINNMDSLDVEKLKLSRHGLEKALSQSPKKLPRHKEGEYFLMGPIPLAWIGPAASLPGKALAGGVAIWFEARLTKRAEIKLASKLVCRFGLKRDAVRRGLAALEERGLVSVRRHRGRCPLVRICTPPDEESGGEGGGSITTQKGEL